MAINNYGDHPISRRKQMPEYTSWLNMKSRCGNPKNHRYYRYGGRGIKVCDEWLNSYKSFLSDVGRKPTPAHTLDRINNDGNYEPGNVRWATDEEQKNNRSDNKILAYHGKTLTIAQWSRVIGISNCMLWTRVNKYGWSVDDAMTRTKMKPSEAGKKGAATRWCGNNTEVAV